jgi:hypothetical protein
MTIPSQWGVLYMYCTELYLIIRRSHMSNYDPTRLVSTGHD